MTLDPSTIAELMAKHGLTKFVCPEFTIERPLAPPSEARLPEVEDAFAQFRRLPPDRQDAALMLQPLGTARR